MFPIEKYGWNLIDSFDNSYIFQKEGQKLIFHKNSKINIDKNCNYSKPLIKAINDTQNKIDQEV